MLNKNGENQHSCLLPYLRGKGFSLSPLSMTLVVSFSYMAYYGAELQVCDLWIQLVISVEAGDRDGVIQE